MKTISTNNYILIFAFFISTVSAINRNNSSLFDKNVNKSQFPAKFVEPRGQEPWGYLDGYGGDVGAYGKSDYYWLIPLVIVIGFGALLLPLLGTLMTTMITQGTINLTAGRRKRNIEDSSWKLSNNNISEYIIPLLSKVEEALVKFENQIKGDVSPLLLKFGRKQ